MQIRSVGTEQFHGTEGQTHMTKLIVAFSKFCERAYKQEVVNRTGQLGKGKVSYVNSS